MTRRWRRRLVILALGPVAAIVPAGAAFAHPLGNFTINAYAGLIVQPHQLVVDYVVDMAEIPAFQQKQAIDVDSNGRIEPGEATSYATTACSRDLAGVSATVDGATQLALGPSSATVSFPPGAAGLTTLRLQCRWTARLAPASGTLQWNDRNFAGHIGWHEVTAAGDRTTLASSDVPRTSVSDRLTSYPRKLLSSPLAVRSAALSWRPGGPALATPSYVGAGGTSQPLGADSTTSRYTGLLAHRSLTWGFVLTALLAAVALGGLHAFAPGHGKTAMAAYLVGSRGSLRSAAQLGLTVTAAHTAGVVALGLAIATASTWAPERLYPWLSLASGALIFATGAGLLRRRARANGHHSHPHPHGHAHSHEHSHDEGHALPARGSIAVLGLAGGLVPSPSAVIVLLGALALHRVWLGLALVLAYGVGMAFVLMMVGVALARVAGRARAIPRLQGSWLLRRPAAAATVSSVAVMAAGLLVIGRSVVQV